MWIRQLSDETMTLALRQSVGRYRYRVFVESLKWELPCAPGYEQDEFDKPGATHLVAMDGEGAIVGYARLLPTTEPYLLTTHFPELLNGLPAPCTPLVWELSRYAAMGPCGDGPDGRADPEAQTRVGKQLLLAAVQYVAARGGQDVVFCTTVAIERLAYRWGVDLHRLGRPHRVGGSLLVAGVIHCTARTRSALASQPLPNRSHPRTPAESPQHLVCGASPA